MVDEKFIFLGAVIGIFGDACYVTDVLKRKAKPNRVTWFLWALSPLIAFCAEIKQGVGIQSLMTFSVSLGPLVVLIASFISRRSSWRLTKLDAVYGTLSLMGIALWFTTDNPNLAIIFSIIADGLASIPTIVKSLKKPESESCMIFFCGASNAAITILAIHDWNIASLGFPIYIFVVDAFLAVTIKFKVGAKCSQPEEKALY